MPTLTGLFSGKSQVTISDYLILLREAILCGSGILLLSALSDRLYYGIWTFPPYQLLNFNISQDVAVFYGRNDWHYYLTQGLPLLLTTYLPFTLVALFRASSSPTTSIHFILITTILLTITILSLISHKEVRFIYPLLPLLHILTAPTITTFFIASTTTRPTHPKSKTTETINTYRRLPLLSILLILNTLIAGYTSLIHQRGVISVTTFLRSEYESLALDGRGRPLSSPDAGIDDYLPKYTSYTEDETFAAFLMPCHSTPWRSQLIHPGLKAWALTCEPPLHLAPHSKEREEYRDEADRFFDDPGKFLRGEVNTKERPWPRYIVGFEGIEGVLREWYEGEMKGFKMRERWRGGNSHWHDDWRRKGDVVVWEFVDGSKVHESRPKEEWLRL
jgi:phosphatidylinositol glycan class B